MTPARAEAFRVVHGLQIAALDGNRPAIRYLLAGLDADVLREIIAELLHGWAETSKDAYLTQSAPDRPQLRAAVAQDALRQAARGDGQLDGGG